MDKKLFELCVNRAISLYVWRFKQLNISARSIDNELVSLASKISKKIETPETLEFLRFFEAVSPEPIDFNELERRQILETLHTEATMFKMGFRGYGSEEPKLERIEFSNKSGVVRPTLKVVVCSDVHLGTNQSNRDSFYQWLDSQSGVSIILLGDILDIWIYGKDLDDTSLIKIVSAEWRDLHMHLAAAKERGCEVHIIPGNHDAFIYYIEAAESDPWVATVLRLTPVLKSLRQSIIGAELLSVAQLHYPYYRLSLSGKKITLTHGHYSSWGWRMLAGLDGGDIDADALLVTASVSLAHKYARLLRRSNNERD